MSLDVDKYCSDLAKAGTEHAEQRAFFAWLSMMATIDAYPLARLAFAVPNGGQRNVIVAARLKMEGVKAGVPDIVYPVPRSAFAGLFIEMKVKNGAVSDAQKEWHADLRAQRYAVSVCWGWRQATKCFILYESGFAPEEHYK